MDVQDIQALATLINGFAGFMTPAFMLLCIFAFTNKFVSRIT